MHNYRATAVPHLGGCLLAGLLAACSGPTTTGIEISDSTTVPTVRASIDLAPRTGAPSELKEGHALEFGWSRGKGSDTQTVGAGQNPVVIGGETFATPVELRHEYDFQFLEAAYRFRLLRPGWPLGVEFTAGVAQANLDLTVSSPSRSRSDGLSNAGFIAGLGLVVPFTERLSLQARLSGFEGLSTTDVTDATRFELYGVWSVFRNVALRGGYSYWKVRSDRDEVGSSTIKLDFSGPSLGLDIAF